MAGLILQDCWDPGPFRGMCYSGCFSSPTYSSTSADPQLERSKLFKAKTAGGIFETYSFKKMEIIPAVSSQFTWRLFF